MNYKLYWVKIEYDNYTIHKSFYDFNIMLKYYRQMIKDNRGFYKVSYQVIERKEKNDK